MPKIYWRDNPMLHDNDCSNMTTPAPTDGAVKKICEQQGFASRGALCEAIGLRDRVEYDLKLNELREAALDERLYEDHTPVPNPQFTSPDQFDKIVRHRMDTCLRVLLEKNKEYSRNGDRLWNFRSAGRCRGKHPLEALEGMEVKHTISIDDMVRDCVEDRQPTIKAIEEKFTDAINYLLLKEALIRENL
jgi:hypothetical protein